MMRIAVLTRGGDAPASGDAYRYAIRVQGHLDDHWSEWLDGMTITREKGGETRLVQDWPFVLGGAIGALYGAFVEVDDKPPPGADKKPDGKKKA